jgi:hypothetical protein
VSAFKLDDCHRVEPPPVGRVSVDIYNSYVMCGMYGPSQPARQDSKLYERYIGSKYA